MNYSDFTLRFPEISPIEQNLFNLLLQDAIAEASFFEWGKLKQKVILLLIAHYFVLAQGAEEANQGSTPLKKIQVDDSGYSVEYETGSESYGLTSYGKEILRLQNMIQDSFAHKYSKIVVGKRQK